jgi:hypothetical protein
MVEIPINDYMSQRLKVTTLLSVTLTQNVIFSSREKMSFSLLSACRHPDVYLIMIEC